MVKCPGKKDNGESCGSELEEGTKFCGECGLKIDQSIFKKRTIQCHGTLEEGGPCDEIIQEGKRFCQNCGWKVDQTLFQIKEKRCGNTKCGAVLPDNSKFCEECGTKVKPPLSDASKQISLTQRQEESKRKRPEIPTQDTESKHEQETDQTTSDVPDKNNSGRSEFESTLYKSSDVEILNDGEDGVEKDVTDVIKDVSVPEEDIGIKEEQNQSIQKETQEDGKENPFHKSNTDGNQIQNQANEGQSQHEELDKHVGKGRNNLEQEDNPVMEKRNKGDERRTEENGGINQEDKEQNQMELVDNQDEIEQNLSNQDKNPVTEEHYQTDKDITEEDGVQNQGENGKSQKNEVDKTPVNEEHNSKEEGNTEEDGGQNQGEDRQSQKNEVDEIVTEEQSLMDVEDNPLQDDQDRGDDGQSEDVEGQNQTYKIDDHFEKEKNHTATTKTPTTGEQKEQTEKYEVDQKPIQVDEEVDQKPTQVDEEKKHMGEDESHRSSRGGEGKKQIEPIHEEGQAEHQVNQEDGQVDARKSHRNEEQNKDEGQNQFNQSQNQGDQKYHGDRIVNEEVDGQNKKDSVKNEQQVSHEQRHNEVDNKQRHMAPGQSKGMNGQNQMNKKPTFEGALNGRKDAGAISDSKKQSESASSISRSNSMRRQDAAAQNISRRGSMKVKGKDTIDVIFHAIESTEGEDVQKAIALQFKAVHGNPSNQPHLKTYYQMKFIKDIPDADNKGLNLGRVFELKVQLRKEELRNGMEYNYYKKTHKNEWKAEEGLTNKKVIRTLQIPSETLKHYDQWHVYDGYIYKGKLGKEKKSYISKFLQAFFSDSNESKNDQRLKTDGCTALDTLIFPLLDPCMKTAAFKEAIDKISMINYGSLRLNFPSSYGMDYDENEYKSWLYKFVVERRINSMESLGSKRVQENKIISVLLIIHMAVELNLCSFLEDRQNTLFVKLQLEPNIEEKSCEIFNTIQDICQMSVGKTKRSLEYFIRYFANCNTYRGYLPHDPSWLNALPLLHLLENRCSPFQRLQLFGSNPEHPNWWGSEEFEEVYRSIKVSSGFNHWRRDPLDTLNGISRYCTLDPFLPRTFMAILRTSQIGAVIERGIIPIEVSCACLSYHIRSISQHHYLDEIRSITTALIAVSYQLCECTRRFLRTGKTDHILAEEIAYAAEIVINIKKMLHQSDWQILVEKTETEATNCMLHAYMASGTVFNNVVLFEDDEGSLMKWWKAKTEKGIWTPFENEVSDLAFFLREKGNINLWNKRFSSMEHLPSEKHATHYTETLKRIFKEWLQEIHCRSVLEYYSGKTGDENNAAEFRACLSDVFFKRIPEILQCESGWFYNKGISSELTKYFNKNWDNTIPSTDLERFISMLMNWPDFTKIACNLVSIESPEEKKRFLSDDCIRSVETGIDVLENISSALRTKTLSLKVLKVLLQKEKTFINMVTSILDTKHGSGTDNQTKNMLNVTRNEYNEYENVLKVANGIVQLAKRTNEVNIHGIVDSLKEVHDADNMSISDLMQWKKNMYKDVLEIDDTPSNLEGLFKIFDNIDLYVSSSIFDTMWKMFASNALKNAAEEKSYNIIDDILKPAVAECQQFVDRAKENRLTVSDVTLIPLWMKADITDELVLLNNKRTDKWIDQSVHGISRYHSVVSSRKLAGALLDVCSQYSLTGNFDSLKDISREVCNKKCLLADLNDLDIGMEDITETEVNAIEVFAKSRDLVEWLKTELQHGTKDLKRFVDLALTSAGDDPLNVNKVTCLQSAVLGYSSLIFGISKETDEKGLMQICREFFVNLHSNNRLPSQLEATRSQLSWFQSVRNLLGSVELMSVEQAELINKRGFYRVGNIGKIDVSSGGKLDLNEVVELRLTEAEKTPHHDLDEKPLMKEQRSKTKYSFSELLDLQSRLMLVAGIQNIDTDEEEQERSTESARANTNRFTLIFDNITRLAEEYTRLWTAGCMLFKLWHVDVYCNPNSRIGVKVNFQIGGKAHSLDGKNEDGNVGDLLATLSTFMENCLERWNSHVNKQRETFYYLNYFTIDQLVILQRELSNVGKTCETSPMLYPMLQCVNHTCTPQQIEQIVAETKTEMHEKDLEKRFRQENTGDRTDEDLDLFVQRLVKAGFSKQFALAAITKGKILPKDIREGILWCMKNKKNEAYWTASEGEEQSTAMKADLWFDDLEQRRKEARLRTLSNDMSEIWDKYLTASSSSASDFFSLEHVAHVLQRLGENDHMNTRREFSLPFKSGIPNLLVCERDEMYTRTLSMYMFEDDADTPNGTYGDRNLPLHDEVLLCTKNTTFEEVSNFFRRAIQPCNKKDTNRIFCMVNADLIVYDVSEKSEMILAELVKNHSKSDCRLIVLCSVENELRSPLCSSLERYKLPPLASRPLNDIREFLKTNFTVDEHKLGAGRSATLLDLDRCNTRVVRSSRPGVGKTLYVKKRMQDHIAIFDAKEKRQDVCLTIPLHKRVVHTTGITDKLLPTLSNPCDAMSMIIHFDIYFDVQEGINDFLFELLITGRLTSCKGFIWPKRENDLYLIEILPWYTNIKEVKEGVCIIDLLPTVECEAPSQCLQPEKIDHHIYIDDEEFRSAKYKRCFSYIEEKVPTTNAAKLESLLRNCGINDPSWSELSNFINFLNRQLQDVEGCIFLSPELNEDLPGFKKFVVEFLIQMSRDFATRSLNMNEESRYVCDESDLGDSKILSMYQMKRTWESSPHPYIFFNVDNTFTFLGFNIVRKRHLVDVRTKDVLAKDIMQTNLYDGLKRNGVDLGEDFDKLERRDKLKKLCKVVGVEAEHPEDPDPTYEITTDNAKKLLAIYMRFRCSIPVIVMGETGCGKTRLIKFLCDLQKPQNSNIKNMILMKVHGGTKEEDLIEKIRAAEKRAKENITHLRHLGIPDEKIKQIYTILFLDEANTTECIGLIKEIMCDRSVNGEPIDLSDNLKIVAACNPYRKHSKEMIENLEKAGLGYRVKSDKTDDKFGKIPMRQLVYRVQALPQSLLPLVWDFGQLNEEAENIYIRQMIQRHITEGHIEDCKGLTEQLSQILTVSQSFMRNQKDECKYVSLRDAERALQIFTWVFNMKSLLDRMGVNDSEINAEDENLPTFSDGEESCSSSDNDSDQDVEETTELKNSRIQEENMRRLEEYRAQRIFKRRLTRSIIISLGVCYYCSLKSRDAYLKEIAPYFKNPCSLQSGAHEIKEEIERCQDILLKDIKLGPNIARNQALKENVFMMVICIEQRIPLFLVGKPGSSKSLAKTVVADTMQESGDQCELFQNFKNVQMVSFQCSHLSTAEGIVATFSQAAELQKGKDLHKQVSVVVLDEVGLAEDSVHMPLKTLHPLLERGYLNDEEEELEDVDTGYRKVAFIGISNWALDPAKMNRGILVQRSVPDLEELENSADGICRDNSVTKTENFKPFIKPMAAAYLELYEKAAGNREFFGLRDFYSVMKMTFAFAIQSPEGRPSREQMCHSVKRNFGGLEDGAVDPVDTFIRNVFEVKLTFNKLGTRKEPGHSDSDLIRACLAAKQDDRSESRYLLLLTENYSTLTILQQILQDDNEKFQIVFGSSFPNDQEFSKVCRDIKKIRMFMETGRKVILLNMENLYESLYDALNQYYIEFGGSRFVDLGIGSHRVKCKVDKKFRLIVVADKQTVYDRFPIPLINRLEKHFLTVSSVLKEEEMDIMDELSEWINTILHRQVKQDLLYQRVQHSKQSALTMNDIFIGFNTDTLAAVVLQASKLKKDKDEIMETAKEMLMMVCTPDAVLRTRDPALEEIYFEKQSHDSLVDFLKYKESVMIEMRFFQITTNSKLLASGDYEILESQFQELGYNYTDVCFLSLQAFGTEQEFTNKISDIKKKKKRLLLLQCETGDGNDSLISCARHCLQEEFLSDKTSDCVICFLIHLPHIRSSYFTGFQIGVWMSVHIDDLRLPKKAMPQVKFLKTKSVSELIKEAVHYEDIEEGNTTPEGKIAKGRYLGIQPLLYDCVHRAVYLVKDLPDKMGSLRRMHIVFQMVGNDSAKCDIFSRSIAFFIESMLVEKELKSSDSGRSWVYKNASAVDHVHRHGTFRRSCRVAIEEAVIPEFAVTIAFLDSCSNMSFLRQEGTWQEAFWMKCIITRDVAKCCIDMLYKKDESPQKHNEVQILNLGSGFKNRMPFSFVLHRHINILFQACEAASTPVISAFQSTSFGKILNEEEMRNDSEHILSEYILDFLNLSEEFEMSEDGLKSKLLELMAKMMESLLAPKLCDTTCLSDHLVIVHETYMEVKPRLHHLKAIASIWEGCSDALLSLEKKPDIVRRHSSDYECTTDIQALLLLLFQMEPNNEEELKTPRGRQEWLDLVCKYRPVVEKFLKVDTSQKQLCFGELACKGLEVSRSVWSKIITMKLFIQEVCSESTENNLGIDNCMILWSVLDETTDMKQLESLNHVEEFLEICNSNALSDYLGQYHECQVCKRSFQEISPVTMKCKNQCLVCSDCYKDPDYSKCRVCSEDIISSESNSQEESPSTEDYSKIEQHVQLFENYRKCCNGFFMNLVSQLCFANNSPPTDPVIGRLLRFVTHERRTTADVLISTAVERRETSCAFSIDISPVFKFFLLQLLLNTSKESVHQHLQDYFDEIQRTIKRGVRQQEYEIKHVTELTLLAIQCIEDNQTQMMLGYEGEKLQERIVMALQDSKEHLKSEAYSLQKIFSIAQARCGLKQTAALLYDVFVKDRRSDIPQDFMDAFMHAKELCSFQFEGKNLIRCFLIAHICKEYEISSYQMILNSFPKEHAEWLTLDDAESNSLKTNSDYCSALGENYKECRSAIERLFVSPDSVDSQIKENSVNDSAALKTFILAFHRVLSVKCDDFPGNQIEKAKEALQQVLQKTTFDDDLSNFGIKILENESFHHLSKWEQPDIFSQNIISLILHYGLTISSKSCPDMMIPLKLLSSEPGQMKSSFLPTMPYADYTDIKDAMKKGSDQNIEFYRCNNGHQYAIGDCGKAWREFKCPVCGVTIGGRNHKLNEGNVKDDEQTGYMLGKVASEPLSDLEIRNLTSDSCCLIRLFVHMSLYWARQLKKQKVGVSDIVRAENPDCFVWEHIAFDIRCFMKITEKQEDEIFLLLHFILQNMSKKAGSVLQVIPSKYYLKKRHERDTWENEFQAYSIRPHLKNMDATITRLKDIHLEDQDLGMKDLLQLLKYDESEQRKEWNEDNLHENPAVWKYRQRITVQSFHKNFRKACNEEPDLREQCKELNLFLQMDQRLKLLRTIPSIVSLQRRLYEQCHRQITRQRAKDMKFKEYLNQIEDDLKRGHLSQLFDDLCDAWGQAKGYLTEHTYRKGPEGNVYEPLKPQLCSKFFDEDLELDYILPTDHGNSICVYVLLDYLSKCQNEFLEEMCKVTGQSFEEMYKSAVQLQDITDAHVISYRHEKDILPIILANYSYTFEYEKGSLKTFDYRNIQIQIHDRFVAAKSAIKIAQLPLMAFKGEESDVEVFKNIDIRQEALTRQMKRQICEEMREIPEIYENLNNLFIAITFLQALKMEPEDSLMEYMRQKLQMEDPLASLKAQQNCKIKHVLSLWLTLSLTKSERLAANDKFPFEEAESYYEKLEEEKAERLRGCLESMSKEKLNLLSEKLFECIMLKKVDPQQDEDYEYLKNLGLQVYLEAFLEEEFYQTVDERVFQKEDFKKFPQDILLREIHTVWLEVFHAIQRRNVKQKS